MRVREEQNAPCEQIAETLAAHPSPPTLLRILYQLREGCALLAYQAKN